MAQVYISVGSNQERERRLRGAVAALASDFGALVLSPVYESPAWGFEGDPFFNLVIGFDTGLAPDALVEHLRGIEVREGRVREADRFCSRTLDLDLLLFEDRVLRRGHLQIPRAEILEHAFVLKPLVDLLPEGAHPETGRTFADHWNAFCVRCPEDARALARVPLDLSAHS